MGWATSNQLHHNHSTFQTVAHNCSVRGKLLVKFRSIYVSLYVNSYTNVCSVKMNKTVFVALCLVILVVSVQGRKTSRSRSSGSGRGSSRKTNPQPVPTSFSNPQATAPKPSLFGWQEKPSHNSHNYASSQSKPSSQNHGYPSSQTGLSGNSPAKQPPSYQESVQRSVPGTQSQANNKPSHSYPSSNGLSGNSGSAGYPQGSGLSGASAGAGYPSNRGGSGTGASYPQGSGLPGGGAGYPNSNGGSGTGAGYPQGSGVSGGAGYPHQSGGYPQSGVSGGAVGYPNHGGSGVGYPHGSGTGGAPPPYPGHRSGTYNSGNHPPPPPPYPGNGYNYGGYGGGHNYHPSYTPQMPGYFGNYGNNYGKGFGGVSRSGSPLTGIGIAGAGVGTILTGLALWNLARSTGRQHHTVIYDNRGQPVAVAPGNDTDPAVDSILKDLANCSLTISTENSTEVLGIPCAIATSFTPEADVKDDASADGKTDNTKCTVTVLTKTGKEFMTTIPCSILLNTAAENNVTEPPITNNDQENLNGTIAAVPENIAQPPNDLAQPNQPSALKLTGDDKDKSMSDLNCKLSFENGDVRDPINPCFAVANNLTVLPLDPTDAPAQTAP